MIHPDLDSPGKRLKFARERAGYRTAKDFAAKVKVNDVTYRAYENDQIGFANKAPKFSSVLGVSTDWLLIGGEVPDDSERQAMTVMAAEDIAEMLGVYMLRQVDISYAMGDGAVIADYPETGLIPFARDFLSQLGIRSPDSVFICNGEGDSMAPTIFDRDLVMVDTSRQQVRMQDRIWALTVAGAGMIKRLRMLPNNQVVVLSDNPAVPEQVYDIEDVYIVGQVVWIGRRM
jgi:Predicted transcriptional regulator